MVVIIFPEELHIAAEGNRGYEVLRLAELLAHYFVSEAQGELEHFDAEVLGHKEMTQFVEKNEDPQDNDER